MKITRLSFPLLLLASIATTAIAQGNNNNGDNSSSNGNNNKVSTSQSPSPSATASQTQPKSTATPTQETSNPPTSTRSQAQSTSNKDTPPPITSSSKADGSATASSFTYPTGAQTGPPMPKLYPEYPSPTVPPTQGAPYLQHSKLPEGTFFIAVGAGIGLLLATVVAWRGIVAWSLHRSVKKAARAANNIDNKPMLRPKAGGNSGGFYSSGPGSALSLDHISGPTKSGAKQTSNSSLFFSPTAGAGNATGERRSAYLPAGYYPAQNPSVTHFHSQSISSSRYNRNSGLIPSPPGSPLIPPSRGGGNTGGNGLGALRASESKTSLSLPPQGRAPSAYLEDLFENHQQQPGGRF